MSASGADTPPTTPAPHAGAVGSADALRRARLEALARRAGAQHGGVRAELEARLAALTATQASTHAETAETAETAEAAEAAEAAIDRGARSSTQRSSSNATRGLADLVEQLSAAHAAAHASHDGAPATTARDATHALEEVRSASLLARLQSQTRQALDSEPRDAGPLNSDRLAHRALALMHEASPAYLQCFMAYADTLARLEALPIPTTSSAGRAAQGTPAGRRARSASRKR